MVIVRTHDRALGSFSPASVCLTKFELIHCLRRNMIGFEGIIPGTLLNRNGVIAICANRFLGITPPLVRDLVDREAYAEIEP